MRPSTSQARRRAREVLQEAGASTLPVGVEAIIEDRGLMVREVARIVPGVYGAIYIDGHEAGVVVSAECFTPGHRRFTLAHELGHFVLEGHAEKLLPAGTGQAISQGDNYRDQRSIVEREADAFAAELLMPPHLLGFASGLELSVEGVRGLADACDVSLSSAAIRLLDVADDPAAVILSHKGTIEWYACSEPLREHAWARRALKREWVPKNSATSRLIHGSLPPESEAADQGSLLLCEWFEGAPAMCRAEEECLAMGRYERVLTILRPVNLPTSEELLEERQRDDDREGDRDWRDAVREWNLD